VSSLTPLTGCGAIEFRPCLSARARRATFVLLGKLPPGTEEPEAFAHPDFTFPHWRMVEQNGNAVKDLDRQEYVVRADWRSRASAKLEWMGALRPTLTFSRMVRTGVAAICRAIHMGRGRSTAMVGTTSTSPDTQSRRRCPWDRARRHRACDFPSPWPAGWRCIRAGSPRPR
jgi:hypothetical protein